MQLEESSSPASLLQIDAAIAWAAKPVDAADQGDQDHAAAQTEDTAAIQSDESSSSDSDPELTAWFERRAEQEKVAADQGDQGHAAGAEFQALRRHLIARDRARLGLPARTSE